MCPFIVKTMYYRRVRYLYEFIIDQEVKELQRVGPKKYTTRVRGSTKYCTGHCFI